MKLLIIPNITISSVVSENRKLKATWSVEAMMDLNAMHNLHLGESPIGNFEHPWDKDYFFELFFIIGYDYENPNIPVRFNLYKHQHQYQKQGIEIEDAKKYILELNGDKEDIIVCADWYRGNESYKVGYYDDSLRCTKDEILKKCKQILKKYSRKKL